MSAGGASVHYLTMSPMSKGLYKNAISLSGTALCWWANIPHPREQVRNPFKLNLAGGGEAVNVEQ